MGIMPGTTICGLADGAAWPVRNALDKFRPEFEEYIRAHQNPAYEPTALQEAIFRGVPAGSTGLVSLEAPGHAK
jgi:NADH-quinone oxidoreductase subunit F